MADNASINLKERKVDQIEQENSSSELNSGPWSEDEHRMFLEALHLYGNQWGLIQSSIKTRSCVQIRSHAQKFFKTAKTRALKKIKNNSDADGMIFLVSREYRNLNNIIQKKPHELYLDPGLSVRRSYYKKKTKIGSMEAGAQTYAIPTQLDALEEEKNTQFIEATKRQNPEPEINHYEPSYPAQTITDQQYYESPMVGPIMELDNLGINEQCEAELPADNYAPAITDLDIEVLFREDILDDKGFVTTARYTE